MKDKDDKFILYRIYNFQDQEAFEELYRRYSPKILRYLVFKLPTPTEAEDILSEVFTKAWDYTTSTKVEKAGGLLKTIARNLTANFYVTRSRRPTVSSDEVEFMLTDEGDAAREIEVSAEMMIMKQCILDLPNKEHQEVIVKRFLEKESISDIAEHLGKTHNNTRVIIHRALRALQEMVKSKDKPQHDRRRTDQKTE
tara:strand:+ start:124 stop:714 length:591 start_codon:yes stop_codon:yes gene_type:complete